MGSLAAQYFDEIVFREDPARRGRKNGEIVELLVEGALEAGFPEENIQRILDEHEAAPACLASARPGDLVVLTPTDVEAMWKQVLDFRPDSATRYEVEVERGGERAAPWRRMG
jgi:cyanophycin synthetase